MSQPQKLNIMPQSAGLYPADDINKHLQAHAKKEKIIIPRTDIVLGQIVVILEGEHCSMRGVYIKHNGNKAVITGPESINGIKTFEINDKHVLKTGKVLELNIKDAQNTELGEIESQIGGAVEKMKYGVRYLNTPFEMEEGLDFYEMAF